MSPLAFLSVFAPLIPLGASESDGNAFVFTNAMSTSHLTVLFNLADRLSDFDVYDVRWPMVDSVAAYKAPPRFKSIISSRAMERSAQLKRFVDSSGWEAEEGETLSIFATLSSVLHLILMPCDFEDPILVERTFSTNVSLVDPCSSLCAIARIRDLRSRYLFVSPLIEPMGLATLSGGELPASYATSVFLAKSSYKMTFFDRFLNFFAHGVFYMMFTSQLSMARRLFGENDLFAPIEPSFVLVNGHRCVDPPVPRTFARIDIGLRSNVVPRRPTEARIDDDLLKFVENPSFRKIVVFSMSTYTSDGEMPLHLREVFARAFSDPRFEEIGFVWRIRRLEDEYQRANIKIVQWIAQRALFEHPKTSAVISHCGRNSFMEAAQAGISISCVPQTGDQYYQSVQVDELGIGSTLHKAELSVDRLTESLNRLLNDERIENKAKQVAGMLEDDDSLHASPNAEWWVRYFVRHGDQQLRKFIFPQTTSSLIPYADCAALFVIVLALVGN